MPGENHHQVVLEQVEALLRQIDGRYLEFLLTAEIDAVEAAAGCGNLVL